MANRDDSLQARFRVRLEREPEGRALTFVNSRGECRWRSFREVYENATRSGSALVERGLAPGDVCVLVLPPDETCATALLGCLVVGAVPVLVAPPIIRGLHSNLKEVVANVARRTAARIVVMDEVGEEEGAELLQTGRGTNVLFGRELLEAGDGAAALPAFPASTDVAAMQLTSGTTGFPRICVWEQRRVLAALDGMETAMALRKDDVCVNWTPLYHDMGLVNNFLLCLAKGVPLAMLDTFDFLKKPGLWLRTLSDVGGTVTWSPNFGFAVTAQRVADRDIEGVRLDRVRSFWNAAERVHLETMLAFHRRFESVGVSLAALKTNFGCAENVGGATFSDPDGDFVVEEVDRHALHQEDVARPVSGAHRETDVESIVGVGRPFPGMSIEILGRDGQPLPDGHVGEVALSSPSRMREYLGSPEETALALHGERLLTGDLGYMRGEELFWVGRSRERINMHGKKFDPSDFERVLLQIPGLREGCFAAFGIDDEKIGTQRLVIVSEVRDSATRPHGEIVEEIRRELSVQSGVTAAEVHLLPEGSMTKTTSGKRRHRFYRQLYLDGGLPSSASQK